MDLQSEAPIAPNGTNGTEIPRQSDYLPGKHASTSADINMQRLRGMLAMCRVLTNADAKSRQCIKRLL